MHPLPQCGFLARGFPFTTRFLTALIKVKIASADLSHLTNRSNPNVSRNRCPFSNKSMDPTLEIKQSLLCHPQTLAFSMRADENKQRAGRGSAWEISATLTWERRPGRAEQCRAEQRGFRVNEWLMRGAWEQQSTYSHSRMPFSRADRKSWVPNFFLVTAWKKKKYREKKNNSDQNSKRGWVSGRRQGVCVHVYVCVLGWEGWRRKVGCREQWQRKSEVFPREFLQCL